MMKKKTRKKQRSLLHVFNPLDALILFAIAVASFVSGIQYNKYYSQPQKASEAVIVENTKEEIEKYPERVKITRIVDRDTVEIADGRKLRGISFV